MISMRNLCSVFSLCFLFGQAFAAGSVEIWSYAFVTDNPKDAVGYQEPISGHGSAIFTQSKGWQEGPMWSHERVEFRLKFRPTNSGYVAIMKVKSVSGEELKLTGKFEDTAKSDGEGCLREIRLMSGSHYILLRRVVKDC